jgi:hypothetical protein
MLMKFRRVLTLPPNRVTLELQSLDFDIEAPKTIE